VVAHLGPRLAAVGGAVEAALVIGRLDHGIDHVGVDRRYGQADAAHVARGKAARELAPGLAGVFGLVDGGLRAAADFGVDVGAALFRGGVDPVRAARIEHHVVHAGVLADLQRLGPGGAAVLGLVQAAVAAGAPGGAFGGHVDHSGVARVDGDHPDVAGFLQTHVLPALAAVDGFVHAVAVADGALVVVLAGADPDDVGVGGVHGHAADGVGPVLVEHRCPGGAGVDRLPDVARRHGHVIFTGLVRIDGEVADPAGAVSRADAAELQAAEGA